MNQNQNIAGINLDFFNIDITLNFSKQNFFVFSCIFIVFKV